MTRDPQEDELPPLRAEPSGDPALDELGRWFAAVPPAGSLDPAALARVARRLEGASDGRRKTWRSAAVGLAFVALASGSAAMWARHRSAAPWLTATLRPAPADTGGRGTRAKLHDAPAVPPAAEAPLAPLAPGSSSPNESTASGVRAVNEVATVAGIAATGPAATSRAAAASSVTAPGDGSLARESAALERALTALRRDHDAAGALTLLERYSADFPAGVLRTEADIAKVDANLALGRQSAALALLNRLPLERVGRGQELELVRAELLATRDCGRANQDFDRVLAAHPPTSLDERALFGRASCRLGLGDAAGGQADLRTYLLRYPHGRFAAAARERLR